MQKVNLLVALEDAAECARRGDGAGLARALRHRALGLGAVVVKEEMAQAYLSEFQAALENSEESFLRTAEIRGLVESVNRGGGEQVGRI